MDKEIWRNNQLNNSHGNLKFVRENRTPRHSRFSGEFEGRRWRVAEKLALAAAGLLLTLWVLDVLRIVHGLWG